MTEYESKHGIVSKQNYELYMSFTDMRNFLAMLPEDKKQGVTADMDSISASVQGFQVGVKVVERVPYSRISFEDDGAPFRFNVDLCFDPASEPGKTDFHIRAGADLNLMMKAFLGPRIKESLDKSVDSIVDMSEGRMPEGFDPSKYGMNV